MTQRVAFADWELGPLHCFEDRWADARFKARATGFLSKFVGPDDQLIKNPALLCRKGKRLNGQEPSPNEVRALELSLAFAFIDNNPRSIPENHRDGSWMVTADNAELHVWPIDLESGRVTKSCGYLVSTLTGGYRISDSELVFRPPLDLNMPFSASAPDCWVLTGIYETVLRSLRAPNENVDANRIRIGVDWFVKAWPNSTRLHEAERLVFLKTAFEGITGKSKPHESARKLRRMFEELPNTSVRDSEILVWSPEEKPIRTRTSTPKRRRRRTSLVTDLEHWFMQFGDARNTIIHGGALPKLEYSGSNSTYKGPFVWTAEYLLRGVVKVLLSKCGYDHAWRSERWRTIKSTWEDAGNR